MCKQQPENLASELTRRLATAEINLVEGTREYLEEKHGQVWSTDELKNDYQVIGFGAPCVVVRRKSDNVKGLLFFQHDPRFYFRFEPVT
ncbi:hypothetical protein LCGC14_3098960 [marine sediment metagenome]|uniref:Uncharacterized protein n=1 Tax=marine sediment metagenome TaxID=412755 RepID=A0A0F8WX60_9ZZZZ